MTSSFQVICKDDEELAIILSAIFGGLIGLGKDKKELEKQIESLRSAAPPSGTETRIESVKSVADAKRVLQEEDYIFYKKPEVWGQKNKSNPRRRRRTKKEMEEANKQK